MSRSSYDGFAAGAVEDLERLAQKAADLRETMRGIQDASPERTEGSDRSGAVRVVVGADGLPESIQVDDRWQTRISPHALGAAVTEAAQEAARRRGEAWSRIVERAGSGQSGSAGATYPAAMPGTGGLPGTSPPRSLGEIADEVIGNFDRTMASPPRGAATAQARAANHGRTLVVMLTESGQMSCAADAQWAAEQSGSRLNQALGTALASAREELRSRSAGSGISDNRASEILSELQAAAGEATGRKRA